MRLSTGTTRVGRLRFCQSAPALYVCSTCRHQTFCQRDVYLQGIRRASSQLPFTERLRRKIWGTENPPGQKDPYQGPGYFEREQRQELEPYSPASAQPEDGAAYEKKTPSMSVAEQNPKVQDPDFVPAETWEGLKKVGTTGHWSEQPPSLKESFRSFLATYDKATSREEFLSSLHQAVVEVITLCHAEPSLLPRLDRVSYSSKVAASISSTVIDADESGSRMILKYKDGARKSILRFLAADSGTRYTSSPGRETVAASMGVSELKKDALGFVEEAKHGRLSSRLGAAGAPGTNFMESRNYVGKLRPLKRSTYPVTSLDFLSLSIEDLELRFAIIKRLSQLTGHRIPDPVFNASTTLMPIYNYLVREGNPKPKKLAHRLMAQESLASFSNITIMNRRQTPVDKDKRLGRWKIIEAELQSKGLPTLSRRLPPLYRRRLPA